MAASALRLSRGVVSDLADPSENLKCHVIERPLSEKAGFDKRNEHAQGALRP